MSDDKEKFVPVLSVLAEYGNAPFLWLLDRPDEGGVGGNWCDGTCWDESFPMSEGLWRKFADWAIEFDRSEFYLAGFGVNIDENDWDWIAFHQRGLLLACWLKEEVGGIFRVVYIKPHEDPNYLVDTRREVLANGELILLPPFPRGFPEPSRFCQKIISGGQTGVDRGALDFAIEHGYAHGGWAPQGREAEDGKIPLKYQLIELTHGSYRQRTRLNVKDSDGTLIINYGELDGGTLATQEFAQRLKKPLLVVRLEDGVTVDVTQHVAAWIRAFKINVLNVAGPRESKRRGIYSLTQELLTSVDAIGKSSIGN